MRQHGVTVGHCQLPAPSKGVAEARAGRNEDDGEDSLRHNLIEYEFAKKSHIRLSRETRASTSQVNTDVKHALSRGHDSPDADTS